MIICVDGLNCPGCEWKNAQTLDDLSDANLDCPAIMELEDGLVLCKRCTYYEPGEAIGWCALYDCTKFPDGFCDDAHRKKNDTKNNNTSDNDSRVEIEEKLNND